MKNKLLLLLAICCWKTGLTQSAKTNSSSQKRNVLVTFSLDLAAELKNVQSVSSIGIRGNTAPLSWNKTFPMTDEDKNGVYEATIKFETADSSLRVKFKYFHDTASWEQGDDRVVVTKGNQLKMPIDKWNVVPLVNTAAYQDSVEAKELYNTVAGLDSLLFDAYNNCKMEITGALFSEDIEFYHDKNGLTTSKKDIVESIRNNICGKVNRELLKGSLEVSPLPGYGAVVIGMHRFHNLIEKSTSDYSKFVTVWQYKDNKWTVTRVISLHK